MYQSSLDIEILSKVRNLTGSQKTEILDYLESIVGPGHNTKIYRKKAMKQIREALNTQKPD